MDKISIIIPVYKVEKYLNKCVESVVNQTYKNLEIILVDDGSPDNCPKMCDEWAKKDERIKVIHKTNGGLSDARNVGIEQASGNYLMFVDGDDYLNDKMCEHLYSILKENDCDFSSCDLLKVWEDKEIVEKNKQKQLTVVKGEDVIKTLFNDWSITAVACAKLYKKELFKNLRFPVGRYHEDEYTFYKILHQTKAYVHSNQKFYCYLQRKTSITHDSRLLEKRIKDIYDAFREKHEFLAKRYSNFSVEINNLYLFELRSFVSNNKINNKEFLRLVLKEYKELYKTIRKHNIKDFLFKNFFRPYLFLYRLKHGIK